MSAVIPWPEIPIGYIVRERNVLYCPWNWHTSKARGEGYMTEREAIEAAIRHAEIEAQS